MCDEQNALPLRRQILHNRHQLLDLLWSQHCRRLVEDQYLIFPVEHFKDLRPMLHAHRNILDDSARIYGKAVFLRELHDLFPGLVLLQKSSLRRLHAQNDIVQDTETFHQLKVLMYHSDP